METIMITVEELKTLVNTAIQFGVSSPELVPNQKGREKIANWMVENTIKDIEKNNIPTAKEFLKNFHRQENHTLEQGLQEAMVEFAKLCVIEELKKHIENPTKPGYRRLDIIKRIKQLENE